MKKIFTKFSAFNFLIWTASVAIIVGMVGGLIVVFGPIDVLRNWTTSVGGENKTFVAGQTIYFESQSEKLISVLGTANRHLVCDAKGSFLEREINIDNVDLKRPAGVNPLRENALTLPSAKAFETNEGEQTLPRVCRIHFNACYQEVYGFREHCEQSETEKFLVVETAPEDIDTENSEDVSALPLETIPTQNNSQANIVSPRNNTGGSTQSSNNTTTNNTNNTTNEAPAPVCAVDTNLLGLVPVKLLCG